MIKNKFIFEKVSIEKNMAPRSTFFQKRDSGQAIFLYRYFFCLKTAKIFKKGILNEEKICIDTRKNIEEKHVRNMGKGITIVFEYLDEKVQSLVYNQGCWISKKEKRMFQEDIHEYSV